MAEIFPESEKEVRTYWGRPPSKLRGDSEPDIIFTAVGHALSSWEYVEEEIASLFMMFTQCQPGTTYDVVRRAFGATEFSSGRKKALDAAAEIYFAHEPDEIRRCYNRLADHISFASNRRNDIAHGKVSILTVYDENDGVQTNKDERGCLLIPPNYSTSRTHPFIDIDENDPIAVFRSHYRFDHADILAISDKFNSLSLRIAVYQKSMTKTDGMYPPGTIDALAARR